MTNLFGAEQRHAEVNRELQQVIATMERYFQALGPHAPVTSFRKLVESRTAPPAIQQAMEAELAIGEGLNDVEYKDRMLNRDRLRVAMVGEDGRPRARCDPVSAAAGKGSSGRAERAGRSHSSATDATPPLRWRRAVELGRTGPTGDRSPFPPHAVLGWATLFSCPFQGAFICSRKLS